MAGPEPIGIFFWPKSIMITSFIDERIKDNIFSLVMYCVSTEFHYFRNAPKTRKLFTHFITTLPITKIYYSSTIHQNSIASYKYSFNNILYSFSKDFQDNTLTPFIDEVGGPKTEQILLADYLAAKNNK